MHHAQQALGLSRQAYGAAPILDPAQRFGVAQFNVMERAGMIGVREREKRLATMRKHDAIAVANAW